MAIPMGATIVGYSWVAMPADSVPKNRYLLTFNDFVEHVHLMLNSSERLIDLAKSSGPQDHRIVKTHAERLHFNSGAAVLNQGQKTGDRWI